MFDNQSKRIREKIKSLYKTSDLTMKDFADKCGISNGTLHNIINTDTPLLEATIAKIAGKLKIDYDSLVNDAEIDFMQPLHEKPIKYRAMPIEDRLSEIESRLNEISQIEKNVEKMLNILIQKK